MKPPAILIVEDETAVRRFIRHALTNAGYITVEAATAAQAEEVARAYPGEIQLAILDIVMPGGSGIDFASWLQIEKPNTKILYISGYADSIAFESIGRELPDAVLPKPFTANKLLARVREFLGEGRH